VLTQAAATPGGFGLTDLEERLNGPERDAAAGAIEASLQAMQARIAAAVAGGLRPDLFARARELSSAVEAARRVLAAMKSQQS
jgi:hypothetical protein